MAAPENLSDPSATAEGLPRVGDTVAGKYQVERVLGRGGMGVVVAARDIYLRRLVAMKFLLPEATKLAGATERFLREAQTAATLRSEHVARVVEVGTIPTGAPYMVMEYLQGDDLSKVSRSRGPLPIMEAVDYVLQACEAIGEAHAHGIIHRDLKPANLFLTTRPDGTPYVKVLDFGLSKVAAPSVDGVKEASLTATNTVVGSPHYMSPEQFRSLKHTDARTDVWALGVILYQLLTGRRPFDGDAMTAVFAMILTEEPAPLRSLRPDTPVEIEAIVARCLEKNVSRRTQSVAELVQAIEPFGPPGRRPSAERISQPFGQGRTAQQTSGVATGAATGDATTTSNVTTIVRSAPGSTKTRPKHRSAALAGAGGLIAVAVVVVSAVRMRAPAEPRAASARAPVSIEAARVSSALIAAAQPTASPAGSASALPPGSSSADRTKRAPVKKNGAQRATGAKQTSAPSAPAKKQPSPDTSKPVPADPMDRYDDN